MKLLSKLICPAALERTRNIDLTWEEIKDVEKGVDEFGFPLTKKDFVRRRQRCVHDRAHAR
eukprot:1955693-Pleurochrysis_carterae.AAC.1